MTGSNPRAINFQPSSSTDEIHYATRASRLALWQTEHVAAHGSKAGFRRKSCPMQTTGDAVQDRGLAKIRRPGRVCGSSKKACCAAIPPYCVRIDRDENGIRAGLGYWLFWA
jgi:hypothetical protein